MIPNNGAIEGITGTKERSIFTFMMQFVILLVELETGSQPEADATFSLGACAILNYLGIEF